MKKLITVFKIKWKQLFCKHHYLMTYQSYSDRFTVSECVKCCKKLYEDLD